MARPKKIEVSALNISMHNPHSPQGYVDLIKRARARRKVFGQGELHALMLGSLTGLATAVEKNELSGEVFRFVKVDDGAPWFNTLTNEQAKDNEIADLNIPPNLRAHMQRIQFIFFPREHELWFISNDGKNRLGPKRMESFFQNLLDEASISQNGPQIEVTALPDKSALREMLKIYQLDRLILQFKRPNPDDAADIAGRIMKRLEQQNVARLHEELVATKGESIKPDAQTIAEAGVAARNGRVEVIGKDEEGLNVRESTDERPLRTVLKVDSDVETPLVALRRAKAEH